LIRTAPFYYYFSSFLQTSARQRVITEHSMKRLILSIALGLLLSSSLWALPSLQLDITGGTYVGGTDETTYSDGPTFELLALGLNPSGTYFLSAAIVPKT